MIISHSNSLNKALKFSLAIIKHLKIILVLIILLNSVLVRAEVNKDNCKEATLKETLECLAETLKVSDKKLNIVLVAVKKERANDELFILRFNEAQNKWLESSKSDCGVVYALWRYGSVKNIKWFQCKIELVNDRIYFIKKYFIIEAKGA